MKLDIGIHLVVSVMDLEVTFLFSYFCLSHSNVEFVSRFQLCTVLLAEDNCSLGFLGGCLSV